MYIIADNVMICLTEVLKTRLILEKTLLEGLVNVYETP